MKTQTETLGDSLNSQSVFNACPLPAGPIKLVNSINLAGQTKGASPPPPIAFGLRAP